MLEKSEDISKVLKLFFEAGVTPQFAENPKDADALAGGLGLFCLCFSFNLNTNKCIKMMLYFSF